MPISVVSCVLPMKGALKMIDRRIKNAEIFRDTERQYTTDQALAQAVQKSTEAQEHLQLNSPQ